MSRRCIKLILFYNALGILCILLVQLRLDTWPYQSSLHNQSLAASREVETFADNNNNLLNKNCYQDVFTGEGVDNICEVDYNCTSEQNQTWPANPDIYNYTELSARYWTVEEGGRWAPCDCVSHSRLAVIIPYRDRDVHLRVLLNNLIPFLQRQRASFRIFVIEQAEPEVFNRAALLNVGFLEASKTERFDCYIFHDVDLVPIDLCNLYICSKQPRHLAVAINKFKYQLPYSFYCGGALAVHNSTMWQINGFTNVMFGWGGEDDDTYARFRSSGFNVSRYNKKIGKYKMIRHTRDAGNPETGRSLREVAYHWKYSSYDGLNSINYTKISDTPHHLYTHMMVRLPGPKDKTEAKKFLKRRQSEYRKTFMKDTVLRRKVYDVIKKIRSEMRNYNPPTEGGGVKDLLKNLQNIPEKLLNSVNT